MIIWGGLPTSQGYRFNPERNQWILASGDGAPTIQRKTVGVAYRRRALAPLALKPPRCGPAPRR